MEHFKILLKEKFTYVAFFNSAYPVSSTNCNNSFKNPSTIFFFQGEGGGYIADFANIAEKPTQFHDFKLKSYQCKYRQNCVGECVMYKVISQALISQIFLFNLYLIAFGGIFDSTHIGILLHFRLL
jgi:hypothetical protein